MRVLVVTTWFPTPSSPTTGIFVARDVAAIATRHQVVVLHLVAPGLADGVHDAGSDVNTDAGTAGPDGVHVERLVMDLRRPDHILRAARRMRALAAGADVVHSMAISALLPFAVRHPGRGWVHTEHWSGLGAPETLSTLLRAARLAVRPLLARPDVVVVVGEGLAESVRALRPGPVEVVPNIVTAPTTLTPRRDAGVSLGRRGPLELVAVGGLIPRKDPLTAVAATAELRSRGIDAGLTWVGAGPLEAQVRDHAGQLAVPLRLTGSLPPPRWRSWCRTPTSSCCPPTRRPSAWRRPRRWRPVDRSLSATVVVPAPSSPLRGVLWCRPGPGRPSGRTRSNRCGARLPG
nr:glycosyltransferase [Ornithinimicrobium pratense]